MPQDANEIYAFGPFQISLAERVLRRDGQIVALTPKCFDTLLELARYGGSVVEKEKLRQAVWPDSFVEDGSLAQNIFTLRKTLGTTPEGEQFIQTIPKRGYRLVVSALAPPIPASTVHRKSRRITYLVAAGVLVATTLVAARWVWRPGNPKDPAPRISLLAVPNTVLFARISPDGRHIAYVAEEAHGQSLWLRETHSAGAGTRLLPPMPGHFWGVSYSPRGDFLYYAFNEDAHPAEGILFRMPASGGESRKLLTGTAGAVDFSPNGGRILFKRYDPDGRGYLLTASPLGEDVRVIAQSQSAYSYHSFRWLADGIHYVERTTPEGWAAWRIPAEGAAPQLLMAPQPKPLFNVNWLKPSEFMVVIPDADSEIRQLWRVNVDGTFRRMTNGINDYADVNLSPDGRTALATSIETQDAIWTASAEAAQPTSLRMSLPSGTYNYPVFTPDGHVVFTGLSNIWIASPDGAERRPMVPNNTKVNEVAVSADGRFVVFVGVRGNTHNLWRIDVDGRNLRQLTTGQGDHDPAISPDGRWVIYHSSVPSPWSICKIALDRPASPVKLADNEGATAGFAISPDSRLFAYRSDVGDIRIRSLADGTLVRILIPPSDPSDLHWRSEGSEILYMCRSGRSAQLWSQPISGAPPVLIRQALPNDVLHLSWSTDERRIAYLQRVIKTDLVLLTNFQ